MRKQPEVEDHIKSIIKDHLALHPLASVQNLRNELVVYGYTTAHGFTLDWHYVAKLMRKVRTENLVALSRENRMARLAAVKERHRALTEELTDIIEGKPMITFGGTFYPTQRDRIAAANTIMKWDLALLFTEAQIDAMTKASEPKKKLTKTRAVILMDAVSETTEIPQSIQRQNCLIDS